MSEMISKIMKVLVAGLFLVLISGCGDDLSPEEIAADNEEKLQAYFSANNLNPQKTASGLYYIIEEPGNDQKPTRSSTVSIHYTGYFLTGGDPFDSSFSRGGPSVLSLRSTIEGWREGIPLFGIGGKGSLFIPSYLAYGEEGSGNSIPPNTPLAFDVELFDFN